MGLQSIALWLSLCTGCGLAAGYDIIRVLRMVFTGRIGTLPIVDFFYLLCCGAVTELLAIAVSFLLSTLLARRL